MKYGKLSRKDIAELERLAETPEGIAALTEFVEKQKEARSAYKRYVKIINKKEKTPNEIRAAFIEKCKRYITERGSGVEFIEPEGNGWVAKGVSSYGVSGVEGVNNEYIEKANALAWLIKDYDFVEETRNAPQPTELVVGVLIESSFGGEYLELSSRRKSCDGLLGCNKAFNIKNENVWIGDNYISRIIDDGHAIYKEVTE